jgi:hypothetical protein
MDIMKIADKKYFLAFLLFISMLSPSCNSDKKTAVSKTALFAKPSYVHNLK